jgi:hypothetical protein
MPDHVQKFLKWELIVAICYFIVLLFEIKVIFPTERALLPNYSGTASLLFLPHAVRVLSTVIVGPKAFFALFPTILLSGYFLFGSYGGMISMPLVIDAAIGASCAPIAYFAVKWAFRKVPDFKLTLLNWRMVFLIGAVASLLNTTMRVTLLGGLKTHLEVHQQVISVFIGDMTGLLFGLMVLVFSFRLMRRGQI